MSKIHALNKRASSIFLGSAHHIYRYAVLAFVFSVPSNAAIKEVLSNNVGRQDVYG